MNSNPDTEEEVKLRFGICQDKELNNNYGDAQEVDVLLQPYQSQYSSPADIGCHLEVQQEDTERSFCSIGKLKNCFNKRNKLVFLTWRCHNILAARGIPTTRLVMQTDEMAIWGRSQILKRFQLSSPKNTNNHGKNVCIQPIFFHKHTYRFDSRPW